MIHSLNESALSQESVGDIGLPEVGVAIWEHGAVERQSYQQRPVVGSNLAGQE